MLTREDWPRFLEEERAYLHRVPADPPEVERKIDYIDALKKFYSSKYVAFYIPDGS